MMSRKVPQHTIVVLVFCVVARTSLAEIDDPHTPRPVIEDLRANLFRLLRRSF